MRPYEGGAAPASTGTTPVESPQATVTKSRGVLHSTPNRAKTPVPRTIRRWDRKPPRRVTLSDIGVWVTFAILTAAVMLAGCMLLTIVWPTP